MPAGVQVSVNVCMVRARVREESGCASARWRLLAPLHFSVSLHVPVYVRARTSG